MLQRVSIIWDPLSPAELTCKTSLVYTLVQRHIKTLSGLPQDVDELAAEAIEEYDEAAPLLGPEPLTTQTELSEQLYEDAIATTSTVEKGNEQLREAKRRTKDSRLFILVFLIGASMSLLFLHYY